MVNEFLEYQRKVKGLSAGTCEEYRKDLRAWIAYAKRRGLTWSRTVKHDVDVWICAMVDAGLKPRTIKKRVAVLRCIYRWMVHEGMLEVNPATYCQTPKVAETLPQTVEVIDVERYLNAPAVSVDDRQMKLLTALLLESGLRISEALNLRWSDLDTEKRCVRIEGKGGKERFAFFGERTVKQLGKIRPEVDACKVFDWTDIDARYLMYETLGRYCKGVHPHLLRHTFASTMVGQGMPIKQLSVLMGHKHVETTEIYTHVSVENLKANYERFKF